MKKLNVLNKMYTVIVLTMAFNTQIIFAQTTVNDSLWKDTEKNYFGTSVFILASLIPDDNTYFFELDYGYRLTPKSDLILGINTYKYTSPMSSPWNDQTTYAGSVVSYGLVTAYQYYFWKNLFVDQMINPLVLSYRNENNEKIQHGFMLLLATRIGYHQDFRIFSLPFYIEAGVEISYWPLNNNVPDSFNYIDNQYKSFAYSPALQFGFKF